MSNHRIGIIGGSGLYHIDGFSSQKWVSVKTPFGKTSDQFLTGKLAGREVVFLPRHGRGHRLFAQRTQSPRQYLGDEEAGRGLDHQCERGGVTASPARPCDIVLVDQFLDRTKKSHEHTFSDEGLWRMLRLLIRFVKSCGNYCSKQRGL